VTDSPPINTPEQTILPESPIQGGFTEIKAMKPIQTSPIPKLKHKTYKCPFEGCLAVFFASSALNAHIRAHTGERPFRCPYDGCGKAFTEQTNLSHHVKIHKDEKPFKCPQEGCGAHFRLKGGLTRHLRIHTGERPFPCTICKAKFSQKEHLASHVRAKHFALDDPHHEPWNSPNFAPRQKADLSVNANQQTPVSPTLNFQSHASQVTNPLSRVTGQTPWQPQIATPFPHERDPSAQLVGCNNSHQHTNNHYTNFRQFLRHRDH